MRIGRGSGSDGEINQLKYTKNIYYFIFACFLIQSSYEKSSKSKLLDALRLVGKVRVQKYWSDTLFTPKIDIFKEAILNTAYVKTLEIFPSARESLSIQTSTSRSVRNQSCLQCS